MFKSPGKRDEKLTSTLLCQVRRVILRQQIGFNDVKQDDMLEAYKIEEVARTLEMAN